MIDRIEWKTEKCHECTNMGRVQSTQFMMAILRHVTSSSGLRKFQADGFLFDCVYVPYITISVACLPLAAGPCRVSLSPLSISPTAVSSCGVRTVKYPG